MKSGNIVPEAVTQHDQANSRDKSMTRRASSVWCVRIVYLVWWGRAQRKRTFQEKTDRTPKSTVAASELHVWEPLA